MLVLNPGWHFYCEDQFHIVFQEKILQNIHLFIFCSHVSSSWIIDTHCKKVIRLRRILLSKILFKLGGKIFNCEKCEITPYAADKKRTAAEIHFSYDCTRISSVFLCCRKKQTDYKIDLKLLCRLGPRFMSLILWMLSEKIL